MGFEIVVCIIIGIIAANAFAAQATLAWDPNTESDLAGYKIHYGTASGSYTVHIGCPQRHHLHRDRADGRADLLFCGHRLRCLRQRERLFQSGELFRPGSRTGRLRRRRPRPGRPARLVNAAIAFSTSATDPNGDSLEYRYDWGGGVLLQLGCGQPVAQLVRGRAVRRESPGARQPSGRNRPGRPARRSPSPRTQRPTTPAIPSGPSSALVNTAITFSTSATDPNGDSLQYRYDWGGGVLSSWGAASQSRSWAAAGQYAVKAQARDSLLAESAWSSAKTVTISSPAPVVVGFGRRRGARQPGCLPQRPERVGGQRMGTASATTPMPPQPRQPQQQAPDAPLLVSPVNDEW
ncbi:MAG: hypothetical protein MZV70_12005 [Desulfobacterales bacterium]|nr:hypothetical protein [Desulfobacterales bacterium]